MTGISILWTKRCASNHSGSGRSTNSFPLKICNPLVMADEVGSWKEIIVKRVKLWSEVMWQETFAPYGIPILEDDILSGHVIENGCDCTKETTKGCWMNWGEDSDNDWRIKIVSNTDIVEIWFNTDGGLIGVREDVIFLGVLLVKTAKTPKTHTKMHFFCNSSTK